jgi:hypothetical protein
LEAKKNKYFIDGFLIRHFKIFPSYFDKENLFDEQKIFLIYLMGFIPEIEEWKLEVDYKIRLEEIKKIDKVQINQTEIDLALINGTDLKELEKEQLFLEKKKRIQELNKKFGIVSEEKEIEKVVEEKHDIYNNNPQELWDILRGKGLIKNGL